MTPDEVTFNALGIKFAERGSKFKNPKNKDDHSIPFYDYVSKLMAENPVACAYSFLLRVYAVFDEIFRIPCIQSTTCVRRRDTRRCAIPAQSIPLGAFSKVTNVSGSVEGTGRFKLHIHMMIYMLLSSKLMDQMAHIPGLQSRAVRVLESISKSHISDETHLLQLIRSFLNIRVPMANGQSLNDYLDPGIFDSLEKFERFAETLSPTQIHKHSTRCKQPPSGTFRCSQNHNRNNADSSGYIQIETTIANLRRNNEEISDIILKSNQKSINPIIVMDKIVCSGCTNIECSPQGNGLHIIKKLRKIEKIPHFRSHIKYQIFNGGTSRFLPIDPYQSRVYGLMEFKRPIISTVNIDISFLKRIITTFNSTNKQLTSIENLEKLLLYVLKWLPRRNGKYVSSNDVLSICIKSNTAVYYLGGTEQASGAIKYILDYICKFDQSLRSIIPLIYNAQQKILKYPSKAEDTGTKERTSKHLIQRVLNGLGCIEETSGQQASLQHLGGHSRYSTSKSWYVFIWDAVSYIMDNRNIYEKLLSNKNTVNNKSLKRTQLPSPLLKRNNNENTFSKSSFNDNNKMYLYTPSSPNYTFKTGTGASIKKRKICYLSPLESEIIEDIVKNESPLSNNNSPMNVVSPYNSLNNNFLSNILDKEYDDLYQSENLPTGFKSFDSPNSQKINYQKISFSEETQEAEDVLSDEDDLDEYNDDYAANSFGCGLFYNYCCYLIFIFLKFIIIL